MLMALIGAGAVTGALVLPRLTGKLTSNQTVQLGTLGTAAALAVLALSAESFALMAAAFLGGLSWIAVLTSFNVSAQLALPDWVRARGLAVFLMGFFGSMALGSILWGQIATATSVPITLLIAATGLIAGMILTRKVEVGQAESLDLSSANIWPQAPALNPGSSVDQPAMVTVEYRIAEADRAGFTAALQIFAKERLRNGATRWDLHQSVEDPEIWIESFHLPSWAEHLEQHARVTRHDADLQQSVRTFDTRESGPVVRHFVVPQAATPQPI